jgi:hypothetical protein
LLYNQNMGKTDIQNDQAVISRAMKMLGGRTSPKKAAAVRQNGAATRFVAKPLAELPCNCGSVEDDAHRATCPRGRAFRRRQKQRDVGSKSDAREYSQSLKQNGELTASTRFQEDIYEYSRAELAAMEAGEFERPLS